MWRHVLGAIKQRAEYGCTHEKGRDHLQVIPCSSRAAVERQPEFPSRYPILAVVVSTSCYDSCCSLPVLYPNGVPKMLQHFDDELKWSGGAAGQVAGELDHCGSFPGR